MTAVSFDELDDAVAELLRKEPEKSFRARWARRWQMRIDRTLEFARKCEHFNDAFGFLAAAAVALLEAQNADEWNRVQKLDEARRLIFLAREGR